MVDWQRGGPKIPSAQLLQAGILTDGNPAESEFSTKNPLQIYLTFQITTEAKIGTAILVHNQDGQLLFYSLSNQDANLHMKTFSVGTHRNICTIPANLFSPGKYSIAVGLWEGLYESGVVEHDILHIIAKSDGLIKGGDIGIPDYGLISPTLTWSSEPENKSA